MKATFRIMSDVLLEARRNQFFWMTVAVCVLFIGLFGFLSTVNASLKGKIFVEAGFTTLWFVHFTLAILFATESIYGEDERKSVYFYLTRNVTRQQYILGKFLGFWLIIAISLSICSLVFLSCLSYLLEFKAQYLAGVGFIFLETGLTLAVVLLLSRVFSKIITIFGFLLLFFFSTLLEYLALSKGTAFVFGLFYLTLPNYKYYSYLEMVVHAKSLSYEYLGFLLAYTLCMSLFYLILCSFQYERKSL